MTVEIGLTQRAPDGWESPRFQAVCVARGWLRQSGVPSPRPPAGNAHRWVLVRTSSDYHVENIEIIMTLNSIDIGSLCLNAIGVVLSSGYLVFGYLVTHRGDFYHIRRWKAAVWVSIITGFLISTAICIPVLLVTYNDFIETMTLNLNSILATIASVLAFIIHLMFIATISAYNQLVWSDDLLDKIWKDPNKGKKSPIQPF